VAYRDEEGEYRFGRVIQAGEDEFASFQVNYKEGSVMGFHLSKGCDLLTQNTHIHIHTHTHNTHYSMGKGETKAFTGTELFTFTFGDITDHEAELDEPEQPPSTTTIATPETTENTIDLPQAKPDESTESQPSLSDFVNSAEFTAAQHTTDSAEPVDNEIKIEPTIEEQEQEQEHEQEQEQAGFEQAEQFIEKIQAQPKEHWPAHFRRAILGFQEEVGAQRIHAYVLQRRKDLLPEEAIEEKVEVDPLFILKAANPQAPPSPPRPSSDKVVTPCTIPDQPILTVPAKYVKTKRCAEIL